MPRFVLLLYHQQEYGKLPPIDYTALGSDPSVVGAAEKEWWCKLVFNVFACEKESEVRALHLLCDKWHELRLCMDTFAHAHTHPYMPGFSQMLRRVLQSFWRR